MVLVTDVWVVVVIEGGIFDPIIGVGSIFPIVLRASRVLAKVSKWLPPILYSAPHPSPPFFDVVTMECKECEKCSHVLNHHHPFAEF